LAESPELGAARAKLTADQITVQREKVEPIPNIVVEGSAGYNFEARETVYGAGVEVEVPLFDRNQGTIQQAKADLTWQRA
jgi:cobalt-zinc-cadmium efflux system outer membrane protein